MIKGNVLVPNATTSAQTTLAADADAVQTLKRTRSLMYRAGTLKIDSFRKRTEFRTELNLKKEERIEEVPLSKQSLQFEQLRSKRIAVMEIEREDRTSLLDVIQHVGIS
jgi:hypothetical protein